MTFIVTRYFLLILHLAVHVAIRFNRDLGLLAIRTVRHDDDESIGAVKPHQKIGEALLIEKHVLRTVLI